MASEALTIPILQATATAFSRNLSDTLLPDLYGVTDGKAIGTYVEHAFKNALSASGYSYDRGNSAHGLDLPSVNTDIKVTSIRQPQSSAPFKSAWQELYGLGYNLLVFVYEKTDIVHELAAQLKMLHVIYIDEAYTADYRHTRAIRDIVLDNALDNDAKMEQLVAYMEDMRIPIDDYERYNYAQRLIESPPEQGAITISNALQWRFGYKTAIRVADERIYPDKVIELG